MNDLRFAFRLFAKSPGFTAVVIFTLALGIGANTAIFSIVNTTFLRALPYPEPDRLVHLSESGDSNVAYPNFEDWYAGQDVFSALAIYRTDGRKLKTPASTEQIAIAQVSADFFPAVGVHAAQGRDLTADDDRAGAAPVVWLTHAAWQRFFAGDPKIIGQTVLLDGAPTSVAGILPSSFRFHRSADLFVPLGPFLDQLFMRERGNRNGTYVIGRLKPGVTFEAARAQMTAIGRRLEQAYPKVNAGRGIFLQPLRERIAGDAQTNLLLLLGAVGMVLLIACVNVANMLLARSFGRAREMAIRTALGASRRDLFRQLLAESLMLAAAGGVVGALFGAWGYDIVSRLVPWEMRALTEGAAGIDRGVLLFVAGLTVVTGIVFGLAPAWQLSHTNPNDALKNTKQVMRTLFGRVRLADGLVVIQVALALMLLVGAGLMIRSLARLGEVHSGLQPDRVLTLRIGAPPMEQYLRDPGAYVTYHERILERVAALPEVESAAFVSSLPFTWETSSCVLFRTDRPVPEPSKLPWANTHVVTLDYFRTMGIPLIRGELFSGHESAPSMLQGELLSMEALPKIYKDFDLVCVISQRMAGQLWPGEDPIGKRFQLGFPEMHLPAARVIGIVGSTTQLGLDRGELPEFYCLLKQYPAPMGLHLAVRTRADPAGVLASVRTAVQAVVPDEPLYDVELMSSRIAGFSSDRRFNMGLFIFFAATALLLAVVGIYGVLACVVGQRTREVGIRMALGAQRRDVLCDVLFRGMRLALPGVLFGLAGAWAVSRLLQSQLFGVTGTDPLAFAGSALLLLLAAVLACYVPARRATLVNPTEALRSE
jgi:putative ABC transport system permease protein